MNILKNLNNLKTRIHYNLDADGFWLNRHRNPDWDGITTADHERYRRLVRKVDEVIKNNLVGKTVLEVGSGRGDRAQRMLTWGFEVLATDKYWEFMNYDVMAEPIPMKFDNVVSIGVLHHLLNDKYFIKALENIKTMAKHRIILGVKIGNAKIPTAKQRPLSEYAEVLGEVLLIEDAGYLKLLVFENTGVE